MSTWGTDLLSLISLSADRSRRDRGADLHAQGAVRNMTMTPGLIEGLVQDGDSEHHCRISVEPLPSPHLALLLTFLRHLPRGRTSSLMLSTIILGLATRGVELGPRSGPAPTVACGCADLEDRCRHVLALARHAADLFDEDPWAWLEARGLSLSAGADAPAAVVQEQAPRTEPTVDDELATYWTGTGETSPVATVPRPAHRERARAELVAGLLPEFTVQGRTRARAVVLSEQAADAVEALYAELIASSSPVPPARRP